MVTKVLSEVLLRRVNSESFEGVINHRLKPTARSEGFKPVVYGEFTWASLPDSEKFSPISRTQILKRLLKTSS